MLNASRRRCCLHRVGAVRRPGRERCSTPHGVVAVCTSVVGNATNATAKCSTPHGVVAVCTVKPAKKRKGA